MRILTLTVILLLHSPGVGKNCSDRSCANAGPQQPIQGSEHPVFEAAVSSRTPTLGAIRISIPPKLRTSVPGNASFSVSIHSQDASESFEKSWSVREFSDPTTLQLPAMVRLPLFGLAASTDYIARVSLQQSDRRLVEWAELSFRTADVPSILPSIRVRTLSDRTMEPGLTLMSLMRWENQKTDMQFGAIVVVDKQGRVRWCYVADHLIFVIRQLDNGHLLYGYGNRADGIMEIDLFGRTIQHWSAARRGRQIPAGAIPVDVDSFHHDVVPFNRDSFFTLSTTLKQVSPYHAPGYRARQKIPTANLVGDEIIEMKRDGTVVNRWSLFSLLDPDRIGYGSLDGFWNKRGYENIPGGTFDWSHSNCVAYDSRDNSLIVSVRHQDAVIKIDRQTGDLKWILGNPRGWKPRWRSKWLRPVSKPNWQYHQHAVEITPRGTLMMFDNGNYRATPFAPPLAATENASRAVEFRVDEEKKTVEQIWEYDGGETPFYSTFLCDVDTLPRTGNVLVTNGGIIRDETNLATDQVPGFYQSAQIFEITYGPGSERIWELSINSSTDQQETTIGWSIYRSQRIAELFAPVRSFPAEATKPDQP